MGAQELSTRLWQERELLDLLVFKLEEEQLLLTSGKTRWLGFATREVEQVLERLRGAGVDRTVEVAALAVEWGLPDDATLRQLTSALERNKVLAINPAAGSKFDPHQHQAISVVPSEQEPNTIVTVLQKGYVIAERVLRPALVTVSAPK